MFVNLKHSILEKNTIYEKQLKPATIVKSRLQSKFTKNLLLLINFELLAGTNFCGSQLAEPFAGKKLYKLKQFSADSFKVHFSYAFTFKVIFDQIFLAMIEGIPLYKVILFNNT